MGYLKTFLTILAVSMMIFGTMAPAMAVNSKAYSFEDNLEVAMPDVTYKELYVPGEILVKFSPGVSEAKINAMNSKNGATVTYTSPYAGFKILNIPKTKSVEEMVEIYSKNPNVEYATANYITHATMVPNDPYFYPYQWNFNSTYSINVTEAWDTSNGTGVVVAVLDTGVAYENYGRYIQAPDLAQTNFIAGHDFINGDEHANDDNRHGTHVAGTIAQSTNNGLGVAGVSFGCTIMPVKVLSASGSGTLDALIDGIKYAADNGADVISMSLSFNPYVNPAGLEDAINYAYNNNTVIVAAAGNDGLDTVCYPAAYENCIAVGATDYNGNLAYYSNYGNESLPIDILAPGGDVTVDRNGDGYGDGILQQTFKKSVPTSFSYYFFQGTSMATPHVSGVAALLIANGVTDPAEVRAAIEITASSKGIVDAYAALNYVLEEPENQPPVADTGGPYFGVVGETITLDGSGSYDTDGTIVLYEWYFGAGETVSSTTDSNTTRVYDMPGTYDVTLTVTDEDGAHDIEFTTITIDEPIANTVPTASITTPSTGSSVNEGDTIDFVGSGYDADGTIVSYEWDFGDGNKNYSSLTPTHTYTNDGTYDVTLTVTDNDGASDTDTVRLIILDTNPKAEFSYTTNGLTVQFTDESESYDGITSRKWEFGDGFINSILATPTHTYASDGTYSVNLTVYEADGDTSIVTKDITVASSTDLDVIVEVTVEPPKEAGKNTFVYATATVTVMQGGTPVSGAIVSGHWNDTPENSDIATTNTDGTAEVESAASKNPASDLTFIFVVDSITIGGIPYTDESWTDEDVYYK